MFYVSFLLRPAVFLLQEMCGWIGCGGGWLWWWGVQTTKVASVALLSGFTLKGRGVGSCLHSETR